MSKPKSDPNSNLNSKSHEAAVQRPVSESEASPPELAVSAAELASSGALDALFEQSDSGQVQLSGSGSLLPELIKAVLERGLGAEMTGHLGYEKGDPDASLYANSRNGSSEKTVASEAGPRCRRVLAARLWLGRLASKNLGVTQLS